MIHLILDTETTGLPKQRFGSYENPPPESLQDYKDARLVQIAWIKSQTSQTILEEKEFKIFPEENAHIKNSDIHHITQEIAQTDGIPLTEVLDDLYDDLKTCDVVVAH